jgi:hypothetical protein
MHDIPSRVPEAEEAHVIHLEFEKLAEKQMPELMDDGAGKRQRRDDRSGDEEHIFCLYSVEVFWLRNFLSYSGLSMITRLARR